MVHCQSLGVLILDHFQIIHVCTTCYSFVSFSILKASKIVHEPFQSIPSNQFQVEAMHIAIAAGDIAHHSQTALEPTYHPLMCIQLAGIVVHCYVATPCAVIALQTIL